MQERSTVSRSFLLTDARYGAQFRFGGRLRVCKRTKGRILEDHVGRDPGLPRQLCAKLSELFVQVMIYRFRQILEYFELT